MDYSKGSVTKHLRSDAREAPSGPSSFSSGGSHDAEVRVEKQGIRGLTLLFENKEMERKWNVLHMSSTRNITLRYLMGIALFQAVFFWSDVLESQHSEKLQNAMFISSSIRLALGLGSLLLCFFVGVRIVQPTQMTLYLANITYGVPTLLMFYSNRPHYTHWDSLYLCYGLAFFMLPKMSPLKFSYATAGSLILTIIFIYLSAFRLPLQDWMLSNVLVLAIFSLMSYVSYSSERATRERWLLQQRLEREKISLRLVAGSIQDDLRRAAREDQIKGNLRRLEIMSVSRGFQDGLQDSLQIAKKSFLAIRGGGLMSAPSLFWPSAAAAGASAADNTTTLDSNAAAATADDSSYATDSKKEDVKKNLALFFKGLMAWGTVVLMSYTFDMASRAGSAKDILQEDTEVNNSTAFVLLMHTFGFSVFLLYFTGQIRWLLINGVVGLTLMWAFNLSGMDRKWIVFGTHTVGYIILLVVVIVMVLVFGGVVMVWSNLMEFLKDILTRYPQVKGELSENKLLEQVIVSVISELPEPAHDGQSSRNMSLEVTTGGGDLESPLRRRTDWAAGPSSDSSGSSSYRDLTAEEIKELELDIRKQNSKDGGSIANKKKSKQGGVHGNRERTGSSASNHGSNHRNASLSSASAAHGTFQHHSIITSDSKEDSADCYFCANRISECLIPVCASWKRREGEGGRRVGTACTELSQLKVEREKALAAQHTAVNECYRFMEQCNKLEENLGLAEETLHKLRTLHKEKEREADAAKAALKRKMEEIAEKNMRQQQQQHVNEVADMLAAHHAHIAELHHQMEAMQQEKRLTLAKGPRAPGGEAETPPRQRTSSNGSARSSSSIIKTTRSKSQTSPDSTSDESKRNTFATTTTTAGASLLPSVSSTIALSGPILDKNGVDITTRSIRRNTNNPNNPLYNPELKKSVPTDSEIRELTSKLLTRSHLNSHSSYDSLELDADGDHTSASAGQCLGMPSVVSASGALGMAGEALPPLWEPRTQSHFLYNARQSLHVHAHTQENSAPLSTSIPGSAAGGGIGAATLREETEAESAAEDDISMPHLREIHTLLDN